MKGAGGQCVLGFDVGETLLTYSGIQPSWTEHYRSALLRVAATCQVDLTDDLAARAEDILKRHNTRLNPRRHEIAAEAIFGEILSVWKADRGRYLTSAISEFFGFFQQRLVTYPESVGVIAALKLRGFKLGALTDVPYGMPKEFVQRDLAGAGLAGVFDALLTSVEVGWRKPEAAGFVQLADKLGARPDELWFVGNEQKDIAGARAAGAVPILINRENEKPAWGQQHTISNLRNLLEVLDRVA